MSRPILTFLSLLLLAKQSASAGEKPIDFNSDIRPILSNACFRCHGPDPEKRKGGTSDSGGLRLDVRDAALADLGGYAAIVPGKHSASELIKRIISTDPDEVMPPREAGKPLSEAVRGNYSAPISPESSNSPSKRARKTAADSIFTAHPASGTGPT